MSARLVAVAMFHTHSNQRADSSSSGLFGAYPLIYWIFLLLPGHVLLAVTSETTSELNRI
jgi:hypothetical protein